MQALTSAGIRGAEGAVAVVKLNSIDEVDGEARRLAAIHDDSLAVLVRALVPVCTDGLERLVHLREGDAAGNCTVGHQRHQRLVGVGLGMGKERQEDTGLHIERRSGASNHLQTLLAAHALAQILANSGHDAVAQQCLHFLNVIWGVLGASEQKKSAEEREACCFQKDACKMRA